MASLHLLDAMVLPCSSGAPCPGRRTSAAPPHLVLNWASASPATGCFRRLPLSVRPPSVSSGKMAAAAGKGGAVLTNKPSPSNSGVYTVGDFMTKREDLVVVQPTTTIDEALELLVENRISGFPVIDDNWKLVGVVSDYDLLALDSISGGLQSDTNLFPEVDSSWKTFNEIQKLLGKTNGKVIGDLMTPAPLIVRETTNLEDAARLLLETKYRRLPVVDGDGKLVGILTRGSVVRGALQIKREMERRTLS